MTTRLVAALAITCSSIALSPLAAFAQGVSEDEAAQETIIVTATRQQTALEDTPISVTVIDQDEITRRNLVGFSDYLATVPGVSFFDLGPGNNSIIIRGLAARPQFDANAAGPITGVYFGEIPMSGLGFNGQQPDIKLVDMERVEVLRGPQGTLYGSSNLSGTVRNIPAAADLSRVDMRVTAGISETARFGGANNDVQGVFNLPVIEDKLAVRGVLYRFDRSGFYRNIGEEAPLVAEAVRNYGAVAVAEDDQAADTYAGGRVSLRWKPTEPLDVTLMYLRQEIEQNGSPGANRTLGDEGYSDGRIRTRIVTELNAIAVQPGDPRVSEPVFGDQRISDAEIFNALIELDLGSVSLISSTTTVDQTTRRRNSLSLTPQRLDITSPWAEGPQSGANGTDAEAFFQEVRFVSAFSGPLQLAGGVYYEDVSRGRSPWNAFAGTDLSTNPFGSPEEPIVTFVNELKLDFAQTAVFGELSWQLTDQIKLTGGGRQFEYDFGSDYRFYSDPYFFTLPAPRIENGGEDGSTFKAGIDYTPTDDLLVYASWSEGFRLGQTTGGSTSRRCDVDGDGFFDALPGLTTGVRTLRPDTVDNLEIGSKFGMFANRLSVNAAVFQLDWKDIPLTAIFPNFCAALVNASKARSRGLELEASIAVTEDLRLSFGGSFVDAALLEDAPRVGEAGDRLPGAPEYNFNASFVYDFELYGMESYVSGDYAYVGGYYHTTDVTGIESGDYEWLDLQAGIQFERFDIQLFGRNLTNSDEYTWVSNTLYSVYQLRPRTIGLRVEFSY